MTITLRDLCEEFDKEPRVVRRWLRANYDSAGEGRRWEWLEGDPELTKIREALASGKIVTAARRNGRRPRRQRREPSPGFPVRREEPEPVGPYGMPKKCHLCGFERMLISVDHPEEPGYLILTYRCLQCKETADFKTRSY